MVGKTYWGLTNLIPGFCCVLLQLVGYVKGTVALEGKDQKKKKKKKNTLRVVDFRRIESKIGLHFTIAILEQ